MERLRIEVRLALRGFRRTPAFCITAITILAIGIGMSVAIFTVFRTVLIRKLPVTDQDRIAVMWTYRDASSDYALPARELGALRAESRTMAGIAGVAHWGAVPAAYMDGDRPLSLSHGLVTGNFFDVLGAHAVVGRLLNSSDDDVVEAPKFGPDVSKNMVLSYHAWQTVFGGDPGVVGRHIQDGLLKWTYTIIGVAPPGLDYPAGVDVWEPIWGGWKSGNSVLIIGRLARGATLASASHEYLAISNRSDDKLRAIGVHAVTFADSVIGNVRPILALLGVAVGLLLLIACLNVGNLVLLRASGRSREIAIRRAIGATYGDIARQFIIEALVIAIAGGAVGLAVAAALLRVLPVLAPRNLPRLDEIRLTGTPLLVTIAVTSIAVVIFGVLPALAAARGNVATTLRLDSRSGGESRSRRRMRHALVASQVALAMMMLAGAALLARSLERLERHESGYISDHLSILEFSWNLETTNSEEKLVDLAKRLESRIAATPGVIAATPMVVPPLLGKGVWQWRFIKDGQTDAEAESNPTLPVDIVGPGYFKTFGIPVVRGRAFNSLDNMSGPLVIVVSESYAQHYWPRENPIGKRLRMAEAGNLLGGAAWRTVVGVARDARLRDVRETTPMLYIPVGQGYWQGTFAIRSAVPLSNLSMALHTAGREADPGVTLWSARSMDQLLDVPLSEPRISALLMSTFGLVALLLAAIGLYGVMASLVRDETREIGIRIALGATAARIRRDVLLRAATMTGAGAAIGLVGAIAGSRLLGSLLYEVGPADPLALGSSCFVLLAVAALAAHLPARRATRIEPMRALSDGA